MNKSTPLPPSSIDLIEYLDRTYPAKCITLKQSLREADREAGRRDLIDKLLSWVEKSQA